MSESCFCRVSVPEAIISLTEREDYKDTLGQDTQELPSSFSVAFSIWIVPRSVDLGISRAQTWRIPVIWTGLRWIGFAFSVDYNQVSVDCTRVPVNYRRGSQIERKRLLAIRVIELNTQKDYEKIYQSTVHDARRGANTPLIYFPSINVAFNRPELKINRSKRKNI